MYFKDTIVTSWDTVAKIPQEKYLWDTADGPVGGRSYLNCVSEYEDSETCIGQAKNDMGECRFVSNCFSRRVAAILSVPCPSTMRAVSHAY